MILNVTMIIKIMMQLHVFLFPLYPMLCMKSIVQKIYQRKKTVCKVYYHLELTLFYFCLLTNRRGFPQINCCCYVVNSLFVTEHLRRK